MEACFHHGINNKKGNCDFLSHNSDFFLAVASLHITILTFFLIILTIWQVFDEFSEKYDKMKKILNQGEAYGADWKSL